jgi:hypothetical protein
VGARQHLSSGRRSRTAHWRLQKPFPKMLLALGKSGTPCCFVMPARIAATDPFRQINELIFFTQEKNININLARPRKS